MINFALAMDTTTGALRDVAHLDEALALHADPKWVVWLDVEGQSEADLEALRNAFHFHALTMEDCLHAHQRPKYEAYEDHSFLVLYEFASPVPQSGPVPSREVMMFVGKRYVVTVHPEPVACVTLAAERWAPVAALEGEEAAYLAYLVLDAAVDTYFPVVDALTDRLEQLEEDIIDGRDQAVLTAIMQLKRQTVSVRKLIAPMRDIFLVFMRGPSSQFGRATFVYFQDVLDHLMRVSDAMDVHRDVLASAVDLYMSTVSNRTNETMKKLTVLSTVLMTCALIAGIYGMNFAYMPELHHQYGYYGALWMMVGTSLVLTGLFRWRGYV